VEELHPFVAGLLDLWRSKRPPGGVPQRSEFNVFTLRPWLGWLTVYEELDGGADFLVRLDGSNIVALTGQEWTGCRMSEVNPHCAMPVLEAIRRAVRERHPVVDRYYSPAVNDVLTFHRVTLPTWEDRRSIWQVIQGMHLAPGLKAWGCALRKEGRISFGVAIRQGHFFEAAVRSATAFRSCAQSGPSWQ